MSSVHSWFDQLPQLAPLSAMLVAGVLAVAAWMRRSQQSPELPRPVRAKMEPRTLPSGGIVYQDAPTVRVVDSQRVDRLRKVVRLQPGSSVDVIRPRPGQTPPLRVTLKAIIRGAADSVSGSDAVHMLLELGGATAGCGPLVKEIGVNEFLVKRATHDEHRSSIFHFSEAGTHLAFIRIKVKSIDPATGTALVDVLHVSGNWPALSEEEEH